MVYTSRKPLHADHFNLDKDSMQQGSVGKEAGDAGQAGSSETTISHSGQVGSSGFTDEMPEQYKPSGLTDLQIGQRVSKSLVDLVAGISVTPSFIIAKGGITSHDIAGKGLGIERSTVIGQAMPGVPVLVPGDRPDLKYIIFPGNVGDENALMKLFLKMTN
jgi:uncharacterized protein YgbK (DUF1537 family)